MMPAAMVKLQSCNRHGGALKLHRGVTFGEVSNAVASPKKPGNTQVSETGTRGAISYLTLGVAADSAKRTARGGARNHGDRESHGLRPDQIANLSAAKRHAPIIGLPFTRMITIHWASAGVALEDMRRATGKFLDLLTKGLARNESATAYIWVAENAGGEKNWHIHILAHVPARLVRWLTGMQRRWLRSITGKPYKAGVIKSDPIGGRLDLEHGNPDLHAVNLSVAFGYHCKGASPATLEAFGIDRAHQPGGRIIGKRCGTSQNIGAKARKTELQA